MDQTDNLHQLLNEIRGCRICEAELPLGANPVLRATVSASILVAGQAPGTRVHNTSIPFNDPSGVRLREWMGVDEQTFYDTSKIAIIPMGFCYPGRGKSGDLPPRKECAATWHQRLLASLPSIKLILAIGQYAQNYHLAGTQKKNLTDTVRAFRDYEPKVIPLPHPSPRNNLWLRKNPWFESELLPVLKSRVHSLLHPQAFSCQDKLV